MAGNQDDALPKQQRRRRRRQLQQPWCFCSNEDVTALTHLAVPTMVIQLSFVVPPSFIASHIGRTFGSVVPLDGYTLAWGAGNLSTLALLQGILNACDTLAPRAFAAEQYRQVAVIAVRGLIVSLFVIVPVNSVLVVVLKPLLQLLGQNVEASQYASRFYAVYAFSFPFYALYAVLWKFLAAQNRLRPMVVSTLVGTLIVLPFLVPLCTTLLGFAGAALAFGLFYALESGIVLLWLWRWQGPHVETWPLDNASWIQLWREAVDPKPFKAFWKLGSGGMIAYLEWAYWEVLTVLIGSALGAVPLSAHSIPRQCTDLLYVVPLGVALALAVRLGSTLSSQAYAPDAAQRVARGTYAWSVVAFGLAAAALYVFRHGILAWFTADPAVLELCHAIWRDVCLYFWGFALFGVTSGISIGLGLQQTFGIVTVVCLWGCALPATYYWAVVRGGGLPAVWTCLWPPYFMVNVVMGAIFVTRDWSQFVAKEGLLLVSPHKDAHDVEESLDTPTQPQALAAVAASNARQAQRRKVSRALS